MNATATGPASPATLYTALSYTQRLESENAPTCPYCGRSATLGSHSIGSRMVYRWTCPSDACNAYVGCHKNSLKPLGTLANPNLRKARVRAHNVFDRLWRSGKMQRGDAYRLLRDKLGLSEDEAHIGRFDIATCLKVVKIFGEYNE